MKLPGDPSAALSMTDFPLNHFWDFEYTLSGGRQYVAAIAYAAKVHEAIVGVSAGGNIHRHRIAEAVHYRAPDRKVFG